jgi:hypothetical protein
MRFTSGRLTTPPHFPLQQQAPDPVELGEHRILIPAGRPAAGSKELEPALDEVVPRF